MTAVTAMSAAGQSAGSPSETAVAPMSAMRVALERSAVRQLVLVPMPMPMPVQMPMDRIPVARGGVEMAVRSADDSGGDTDAGGPVPAAGAGIPARAVCRSL